MHFQKFSKPTLTFSMSTNDFTLCKGSTVSLRVLLGIERNQLECIAVFFIACSLDLVGAYRTTMGSFDLRRNRLLLQLCVIWNMWLAKNIIRYVMCMVFYHTGGQQNIAQRTQKLTPWLGLNCFINCGEFQFKYVGSTNICLNVQPIRNHINPSTEPIRNLTSPQMIH